MSEIGTDLQRMETDEDEKPTRSMTGLGSCGSEAMKRFSYISIYTRLFATVKQRSLMKLQKY